jgi:hypothetical protein
LSRPKPTRVVEPIEKEEDYVFHVIVTANSNYFPNGHKYFGSYVENELSEVRNELNLDELPA